MRKREINRGGKKISSPVQRLTVVRKKPSRLSGVDRIAPGTSGEDATGTLCNNSESDLMMMDEVRPQASPLCASFDSVDHESFVCELYELHLR